MTVKKVGRSNAPSYKEQKPVLLGEPNHTPYDLHFSVFGFPVRVHPLFWIMGLMFGIDEGPILVLIATCVAFVSVLVHELGHAFVMRHFGRDAHIVLLFMGGLAIEGSDSSFAFRSFRQRSMYEQILISAAGPGAGFVLAGIVVAVLYLMGGSIEWHFLGNVMPYPDVQIGADPNEVKANLNLSRLFELLLVFNLILGVINLFPVFPLDGGQIARAAMVARDPWQGLVRSLWLSVITGGLVAILSALALGRSGLFLTIMFGALAFGSYQALQQLSSNGPKRPW